MGNYAALDDVQRQIPEFSILPTSKPTEDQVEAMIEEAEAEIDSYLTDQGYTVPVTGARAILMLRGLTARRVAADVLLIAYPQSGENQKVRAWLERWEAFTMALKQGRLTLPGLEPLSENEPLISVVRTPTRDDFFTDRGDISDWDE